MRPVHVVILLAAGALGGAVLMKVVHPGRPAVAEAVPAVSAPAAPPAVQATPEAPPVAEPKPEPTKPSPMPALRRSLPRPAPVHRAVVAAVIRVHTIHPVPPPMPVSTPPQPPPVPVPAPTPAGIAIAPPPAAAPPVIPFPPAASAESVPQPHQVTLNAGISLPVRLVDGLSSERNEAGDVFAATLDRALVAGGFAVAERGARVEGRIIAVDHAKVGRPAALALELTTLHTSDGQTVPIETEGYFQHADPPRVNSGAKIAGGALIGAAIGALAGGGKGAAIGAGIGGGAGVGDVLLVRRKAELPSETMVTFRLKNSVHLTEQLH